MKVLNPELEAQLDALAEICCNVLKREEKDSSERAKPLIEALVKGGYARLSDINLQARLEKNVRDKCQEISIHRRGELSGITGQMQSTFDQLVTWQTQTPRTPDGTKPANISSATDA
jgi:hypothetical protein